MNSDKSKIIILLPIIFITATVSRVSLPWCGVRCYRVGVLTPTEQCRPLVMRDTAQCPMVPAHWRQHTGHCSSAPHTALQQSCTITEKAPTRAFSWLKAATTAFTFKTLLRHYAKRALTPR